jgi:hypothetical protein
LIDGGDGVAFGGMGGVGLCLVLGSSCLMCLAAGCGSGLYSLVRLMMLEVEYYCLSDI